MFEAECLEQVLQVFGKVVDIYYLSVILGLIFFLKKLYCCSKPHSLETSTMLEQVL